MAITPDKIMMLAHLGDWVGSRMAPDNPFAGYAQQLVSARNFAKQLQTPGGAPGAVPPATPVAPESKLGGMMESPFASAAPGTGYQPPSPGTGYNFGNVPEVTPEHRGAVESGVSDLFSQAMEPGSRTVFDEDNNVTYTRKTPAQQQKGVPAKKEEKRPQSVTNPFWSLG